MPTKALIKLILSILGLTHVTTPHACDLSVDVLKSLPISAAYGGEVARNTHVWIGNNDTELVTLRITSKPFSCNFSYNLNKGRDTAIDRIDVFTTGIANGSQEFLDSLNKVSEKQKLSTFNHKAFLVIKLSRGSKTESRQKYKLGVIITGDMTSDQVQLDIEHINASFSPSNLLIQANTQPRGASSTKKERLNILRVLLSHGFNGFLLNPQDYSDPDFYKLLNEFSIDNEIEMVLRIPALKLFTHKTLKGSLALKAGQMQFPKKECAHIKRYIKEIRSKGYLGKLSYKIWDEPTVEQYPMVIKMYRDITSCTKGVYLEIGEHYIPELQGIIDIWVSHLNFIKKIPENDERGKNDKFLYYANYLHGLTAERHSMRNIGWLLWRHNLKGYHFWSVANWKYDPRNPKFERSNSFGRGTFVYRTDGRDKLLRSYRLEEFSQGLQDYKLLNIVFGEVNSNMKDTKIAKMRAWVIKSIDGASLEDTWIMQKRAQHNISITTTDLSQLRRTIILTAQEAGLISPPNRTRGLQQ
jgi:hypothetical protein